MAETDKSPRVGSRFETPELVVRETGVQSPEQQAYLHLMRTAQTLGADLTALFEGAGLSGKQYNVLRSLRRAGEPGATVSEVARQMTDRSADVTRLVDRLVRDGLATRAHDAEDRRVVRVRLSEKGAAALRALDAPLLEIHRRQLGHMTAEELAQLMALLRKARREPEGA